MTHAGNVFFPASEGMKCVYIDSRINASANENLN